MKNSILFVMLCLINSNLLYSQDQFSTVKGIILDNGTENAIPYVTIQIQKTTIGTITNVDGEFELRIPQKYADNNLIISSIGYKTDTIRIKPALTIKLQENNFDLNEVVVKPLDPLEVLKSAIAKIPENYSTIPVELNAFYRGLVKEDTTYINVVEAVCDFHYAPYNEIFDKYKAQKDYFVNRHLQNCTSSEGFNNYFDLYTSPNDQLKIVESRISNYNTKTLSETFTIGGPLQLIASNKSKYLNDFMDVNHFKHYKYKIEGYSFYNNKDVIVISFQPKAWQFRNHNPGVVKKVYRKKYYNAEFAGKIYIDKQTYAFIRFDYNIVRVKKMQKMQPDFLHVTIDYKNLNNKWYLSQITKRKSEEWYRKSQNADSLITEQQLIVNNIQTQDVKPFKKEEIVPHSAYFTLNRYPIAYNADFWKHYNILTYNKLSKKATNDLQRKESLEQQFIDMQAKNDSLPQPLALKIDSVVHIQDTVLVDPYKWLEDKSNENTTNYLREENQYTYNYYVPLHKLQNDLTSEMLARYPKRSATSDSLKTKHIGAYTYFFRYDDIYDYPIITRKDSTLNAKEEPVFNFHNLEEKYDYFDIPEIDISPDNKYLSFSYDSIGNEKYKGFIYEIGNKKPVKQIPDFWDLVWSNKKGIFYYVRRTDGERPSDLYCGNLNSSLYNEQLIYHEPDRLFDVNIKKSQLNNFLFVSLSSMNQSECRYIDLSIEDGELKIFYPREKGHLYRVKEGEKDFYILSNKDAVNNRLFVTPKNNTSQDIWKEIISNRKDTLLSDFYVTKNCIILNEIANAKNSISTLDTKTLKKTTINSGNETSSLFISDFDYDTDSVLLMESDFNEPDKFYKYSLSSHNKIFYRQTNIKGYNPDDYITKLVWGTSNGGEKIPISLIYSKKIKLNGNNPLLLEGYGSYGLNYFPSFSVDKISLLQRGFIYAIAHVRGSSMLGNQWHKDGMLLNKTNTFNDFITCAEYLVKNKYTNSNLLFACGGSCGGMLMGNIANNRPDLFRGLLIEHPAVCTLDWLKDSEDNELEFGNPFQNKQDFNNILSYSPYQNVKKKNYPAMLFISGYNDLRVKYWNATKMVARLRANNTSENPILLRTVPTGHTGGSDLYSYCKEMAYEYAFIMDLINKK